MTIIGLHYAKHADNLANVVRVCSAYGINSVQVSGPRMPAALKETRHRVFRHPRFKSVRIELNNELIIPDNYIPVAVEIVDGAQLLPFYKHRPNAMYIFGPEDGNVPSKLLRQCHDVVRIPMEHCINLSHAVSTVLYDRLMKVETRAYD
jgi:tRNA(Leu) C34 or U34 (ribose-2'-O)-methylase TrmL